VSWHYKSFLVHQKGDIFLWREGSKYFCYMFHFHFCVSVSTQFVTYLEALYRVFFIEGQMEIGCKMLKVSLFHVVSGLKTEVTMGDLISDQKKSPFYVIDAHINLQKLKLEFTENELKSCILTIHDQQSLRKFKSFIQYSVHWFKNIINITFIIHINQLQNLELLEIVGKELSKNRFSAGFL